MNTQKTRAAKKVIVNGDVLLKHTATGQIVQQGKPQVRPAKDPTITEGVKKVFICYGEVLRKLANE